MLIHEDVPRYHPTLQIFWALKPQLLQSIDKDCGPRMKLKELGTRQVTGEASKVAGGFPYPTT